MSNKMNIQYIETYKLTLLDDEKDLEYKIKELKRQLEQANHKMKRLKLIIKERGVEHPSSCECSVNQKEWEECGYCFTHDEQ